MVRLLRQYTEEDYGNPSSSHTLGQKAARAIREARRFFADHFRVSPEQIIFTGGGTEANNLALCGVAIHALTASKKTHPLQVVTSSIEHPSVGKTAASLKDFGLEVTTLPINLEGKIGLDHLSPETFLMSIQSVNNIVGTVFPIEAIAQKAKSISPRVVFHTDAVQAFGKIFIPQAPSAVDLISISAHKIGGPKGIGALVVLNKKLLHSGLRPLIWGGDQENGFRSGTQNAGLIAGFHRAAQIALQKQNENWNYVVSLQKRFRDLLLQNQLIGLDPKKSRVHWNSPPDATPYIVNISVPGISASPLARLLEERQCLVSVGSACSSKKAEPEPVLAAMGFSSDIQTSGIRISFSKNNRLEDLETLILALQDSIRVAELLQGRRKS